RGPHARRRGRRPAMGPARLRGAGAHLEQRPRHPRVVPRAARPPRGGPRDLSGPGVARRFTPAPPRGDGADTSAPYLPQLPGRPPLRRTRRNPRRGRHVTSNLRRWTTFLALPLAGALLAGACSGDEDRSEEHTSELQSRENLVCRLLLRPSSHRFPYTTLFRSRGATGPTPLLPTFRNCRGDRRSGGPEGTRGGVDT